MCRNAQWNWHVHFMALPQSVMYLTPLGWMDYYYIHVTLALAERKCQYFYFFILTISVDNLV